MGNCLGKKKGSDELLQINDTEMLREEGVKVSDVDMNTSNICDTNCTRVNSDDDLALLDSKPEIFESTQTSNSPSSDSLNFADVHKAFGTSAQNEVDMSESISEHDVIENILSYHDDNNKGASNTVLQIIQEVESEENEVALEIPSSSQCVNNLDRCSQECQNSTSPQPCSPPTSTSPDQTHAITVSDSSPRDISAERSCRNSSNSLQRLSVPLILQLPVNQVDDHPKLNLLSPLPVSSNPLSLPVTPLSLMAVNPLSLPSTALSYQYCTVLPV